MNNPADDLMPLSFDDLAQGAGGCDAEAGTDAFQVRDMTAELWEQIRFGYFLIKGVVDINFRPPLTTYRSASGPLFPLLSL